MTDKVQLIRAEIERYKKLIDDPVLSDNDLIIGESNAINHVLKIINPLPEEPVSENLEKAACNYGDELDNVLSVGIDDDNSIGEYATQAFKAGAKWQQEQIKSKAIDGLVICDKELTQGYKDIVFAMPNDLKVDDKVKVIIIKED